MNVTSLPDAGANFRVYKTTANGGDFFGNATALTLGSNTITVGAVAFDRTVKFQFSSGAVEFDALSLNGVDSDCLVATEPEPDVLGCMDASACNYNMDATSDDSSCTYAAEGFDCAGNCVSGDLVTFTLSDSFGDGWDYQGDIVTLTLSSGEVIGAQFTDGYSFTESVCLDISQCITVTVTGDDYVGAGEATWSAADENDNVLGFISAPAGLGSSSLMGACGTPGCMDASACNYNMDATSDDSSCTYAAEGFDCDGNCVSGTLVSYTAGSYAGENSFTISDCDGVVLAEMTSGSLGFNSCVELGDNYSISLVDSYGDSWNGGSLSVGGAEYTVGYDDNGGSSFSTLASD
jgi:hypothetical protein